MGRRRGSLRSVSCTRPRRGGGMHAVVIHETGPPDVLQYQEIERPEPGDGEVLIRVRAASVNPTDWKSRRGMGEDALPAVLGKDVSGTVEVSRTDAVAGGGD